jgi:hypothetical protein
MKDWCRMAELVLVLFYPESRDTSCSARDWDDKDYLRIIPRVVW